MALLRRSEGENIADAEPWTGEAWEYKTINLNWKASIAFEDEFNKLGRRGWEFQAMVERGNVHRAIFKRRAPASTG